MNGINFHFRRFPSAFSCIFLTNDKRSEHCKISFNFERDQKQCQTETVVIGVSSFFLVQIIGVAQA